MPVHGEYRHLKHHSDLALKLGMDKSNVFTLETGQVLEISQDKAIATEKVHTGVVFVDGIGIGDVGNIVLRDRRDLGPDIITRGFIYARESEGLIKKIKDVAKEEIEICLENNIIEWQVLKSGVRKSVEQLLYHKTKRRPSVFPIIMEV